MQTYYYVHTGHRIGLDRFRRAATIIRALGDLDITLLTSDYRIAQCARDFGVKKSVGVDVVRNIPQISHHGDQIIFDSTEANPIMMEDIREYFSTCIRVSDQQEDQKATNEYLLSPYLEGEEICKGVAVDKSFFEYKGVKDIEISYFFGDDDYEKDLEKNFSFLEGLELNLQLGFYYFLDYEEMLKQKYQTHTEFEEYEETIMRSKVYITASPQAILEALASNSKPIYIQREDYTQEVIPLFESLNIPIIYNYNKEKLSETLATISDRKYHEISFDIENIANFIKNSLN